MFNRSVSRRRLLAGTVAAAGALVLSVCRPARAPGSGGDEAAASSTKPVTILFHTRLGTHADRHISRKALFEEQNPGIAFEFDPLSEGWLEILRLVTRGFRNRDIAGRLLLSEGTGRNSVLQ